MEKQKPWQLFLIIAVFALTLYNIFPTIFYYSKPLKEPIDQAYSNSVAQDISTRVDGLEQDALGWVSDFAHHLRLNVRSVEVDKAHPRWIKVSFSSEHDASVFKALLPRAGSLITFVPSQLDLGPQIDEDPQTVIVERKVAVNLPVDNVDKYFHFSPKYQADGKLGALYRSLIEDRVTELAMSIGGESVQARQMKSIISNPTVPAYDTMAIEIAKDIVNVQSLMETAAPIVKRYYASFTQGVSSDAKGLIDSFISRLDTIKGRLATQRTALIEEQVKLKAQGHLLDSLKEQELAVVEAQKKTVETAIQILQKQGSDFIASSKPLTAAALQAQLAKGHVAGEYGSQVQRVELAGYNPFIEAILVDWTDNSASLKLYGDVQAIRLNEGKTEVEAYRKDKLNQLIVNEVARISRVTDESITPAADGFAFKFYPLSDTQSILAMNLGEVAALQVGQFTSQIKNAWLPQYTDLQRNNYPVMDYATFRDLPSEEQKLGLVVYNPAMDTADPPQGFRNSSIYVIARGLNTIISKAQVLPDSPETKKLLNDFQSLQTLLQQNGFIGYSGASYGIAEQYKNDFIFELSDYYANLLKATREDFTVHGKRRYAVLPYTNVEQRILTANKIGDRIHEDLLKWKEEYNAAQVDLDPSAKLYVPPPSKNVYWDNVKLSAVKYFRGDDRKILRWGLDLSGGKSVRIGLLDQNNKPVTDPADLNQAVNELYTRINKMGVSERSIRVENANIILEFPGVQGMSAAELVKASAMYFHIVNEKFAPSSPSLGQAVNTFLQDVWNEAVVTNRKDVESINEIARKHLGMGQDAAFDASRPRSSAAQLLYDNGLRIAGPKDAMSSAFDDTLSSVAKLRGDDYTGWFGQTHPLAFVFYNYALDGASLDNVQTGYEPSEGNILMFSVKSSYDGRQSGSPRDDFYAWTSQFAEDKIAGTAKDQYTHGRGWRLAVVLNDEIINWPYLKAALRDAGTISGRFTQREISKLASDLKAGSLSFKPRILSEQNISPELGKEERQKGLVAAGVGILLVILIMVSYYRFAGVVASCAVLFTLPIMCAILQNLDAALSLPGIAAIVLTIGMAVDANVLVFERTREEFKLTGRLASSLQAGYRKAFTAIVDSNVTTILAAFILIQFDSGPIKGFALTLIIGIIASMFTALFLTRYFFAGWLKRTKAKALNMAELIHDTKFNFLAWYKPAMIISLIVIAVGGFLFVQQRKTIFGMDFTGGYSLIINAVEEPNKDYRQTAIQAFIADGLSPTDFQVRELSHPNQLLLQFGVRMEENGYPFHGMPEELTKGTFRYNYEKNPRIDWVVNTLKKGGISIQEWQLNSLDASWTVMSGQLSDAMRNNAIIAILCATLVILIYITFRFELKYGIGAVIGLVHDVLLTLAILAVLHELGAHVQIDLQVIGAIMVLIGYSLNDTIIVFDRIREDHRLLRKLSFPDVINHALNVTLSRTLLTSGTTLAVLLALVIFGGSTIFTFSLVMLMGVLIGTFSSLFISSPVMLYFHNREIEKQNKAVHTKTA